MEKTVIFYGQSGRGYEFTEVAASSAWVHMAGLAMFIASKAYGCRIIKIAELTGRDHDVRPIWAFHDAQRYGADTVFVSVISSAAERRDMIEDMEAGLDPVIASSSSNMALAA